VPASEGNGVQVACSVGRKAFDRRRIKSPIHVVRFVRSDGSDDEVAAVVCEWNFAPNLGLDRPWTVDSVVDLPVRVGAVAVDRVAALAEVISLFRCKLLV